MSIKITYLSPIFFTLCPTASYHQQGTFFPFISNRLPTLAPHPPAKPWTYSTGYLRMFKKIGKVLFVVNKDQYILIYNTMSIYSYVETGLWSVYITYFPVITFLFECTIWQAFCRVWLMWTQTKSWSYDAVNVSFYFLDCVTGVLLAFNYKPGQASALKVK